ncbi:MAG: hypothetical protein GW818_10025, partial [Flavobacteriales bacterium]|nr:hypothetical protein [Flavobacteriales bacterium]
ASPSTQTTTGDISIPNISNTNNTNSNNTDTISHHDTLHSKNNLIALEHKHESFKDYFTSHIDMIMFIAIFILFIYLIYRFLKYKLNRSNKSYLLENESNDTLHKDNSDLQKEINLELESQTSKENNILDTKARNNFSGHENMDKSIDSSGFKKYDLR